METECKTEQLEFQGLGRRDVVGRFDGGRLSSDAGGLLLLREVSTRTGLLARFAQCFTDHRDPQLIEHTVEELVSQRVLAQACGYEDVNDHDTLRDDGLLAVAVGKGDVTGARRKRERDRGHALAGKSTLNRLEGTPSGASRKSRYKKIEYDAEAIEGLFVDAYLRRHERAPEEIVLDVDATDDPLHGHQEGRFFHGYYRSYCYLPLYIFCGDALLAAKLRRSNIDAAAGVVEEIERIVGQIRQSWPEVKITVRGDAGFAREELMTWCEGHGVEYVLGLARNARLEKILRPELEQAQQRHQEDGGAVRIFKDFTYRTRKTWTRERRVVGKAEHLPGKANPRFIVTSLGPEQWEAQVLYEKLYCARGDMENRIKEQQLDLFADRTSMSSMRGNQLRLWIASLAYVLVAELRRVGLAGTQLARAQAGTIRTRLFKLAGRVTISVRRVLVSFSEVFPLQELFAQALTNIRRAYPPPG